MPQFVHIVLLGEALVNTGFMLGYAPDEVNGYADV